MQQRRPEQYAHRSEGRTWTPRYALVQSTWHSDVVKRTIAVLVLVATLGALPASAADEELPPALLTPGGVLVAVTGGGSSGYWVTTPCGRPAHVSKGRPIRGTTVVLDPGHGGEVDTGAVARTGMAEKQLNLTVAQLTRLLLQLRGIDTVLTRSFDHASRLWVRSNLADVLGAEILVSIHHNAPTPGPSDDPGIEVFVQRDSEQSKRLGGLLWEETRSGLGRFDVAWAAADDAGVMTVLNTRGDDAYGMIRHPETPSALVELGYISNPAEAELHLRPAYVWMASLSVATAIERYLETEDGGSGYVEGRIFNPRPGIGSDLCVDPALT